LRQGVIPTIAARLLWRWNGVRAFLWHRVPASRLKAATTRAYLDLAAEEITAKGSLSGVSAIAPGAVMNASVGVLGASHDVHGHAGFDGVFEDFNEAFDQVVWTVRRASEIPPGDLLLVVFGVSAVGKGAGVPMDSAMALLMRFERGHVTRMDAYRSESEALAAADAGPSR
jgi:hypothetical protein